MARYRVAPNRRVTHGETVGGEWHRKDFTAGQEIELDEPDASQMLEGGHIVPLDEPATAAGGAAPVAPPAPPEPAPEETPAALEVQVSEGTRIGGEEAPPPAPLAPAPAPEPPKRGPGRPSKARRR